MTTTTRPTATDALNGIDLGALHQTVDTISSQPGAAAVVFRGRTVWDQGTAGDGFTEEMEQAGAITPRHFRSRGDHPPALLGADTGPTAGEALLAALGSCITATFVSHAAACGVEIHGLEVAVEGALDLRGFLQLDDTRAGFQNIGVTVRVDTDADDDVLSELLAVTRRASPVYNSISEGVSVSSDVDRTHGETRS